MDVFVPEWNYQMLIYPIKYSTHSSRSSFIQTRTLGNKESSLTLFNCIRHCHLEAPAHENDEFM